MLDICLQALPVLRSEKWETASLGGQTVFKDKYASMFLSQMVC